MLKTLVSAELAQTLRRRLATLTGAVLIGLVALCFAALADTAQRLFTSATATIATSGNCTRSCPKVSRLI